MYSWTTKENQTLFLPQGLQSRQTMDRPLLKHKNEYNCLYVIISNCSIVGQDKNMALGKFTVGALCPHFLPACHLTSHFCRSQTSQAYPMTRAHALSSRQYWDPSPLWCLTQLSGLSLTQWSPFLETWLNREPYVWRRSPAVHMNV